MVGKWKKANNKNSNILTRKCH